MSSRGRVAIVLAMAVAAVAAARFVDLDAFFAWGLAALDDLGPAAGAAFVAVYVASAVLFLPSTGLDLGAGAAFGVVRGSLLVSLASLAGATASFLLARFLVRDWLLTRLEDHPGFRRLDEAVRRDGWKIVVLARLSPVFPFWLLNYGFGVTRLPLRHFVLATWAGMLPLVILYVYAGSLAAGLAGSAGGQAVFDRSFYVLGIAATVGLMTLVTRIARRALEAGTEGAGIPGR